MLNFSYAKNVSDQQREQAQQALRGIFGDDTIEVVEGEPKDEMRAFLEGVGPVLNGAFQAQGAAIGQAVAAAIPQPQRQPQTNQGPGFIEGFSLRGTLSNDFARPLMVVLGGGLAAIVIGGLAYLVYAGVSSLMA